MKKYRVGFGTPIRERGGPRYGISTFVHAYSSRTYHEIEAKDMMELINKIKHQDAKEAGLDLNTEYHLEIEEIPNE